MITSRLSMDVAAGTTTRGMTTVAIAMMISNSLAAAVAFIEPSPTISKTMILEETGAVIVL